MNREPKRHWCLACEQEKDAADFSRKQGIDGYGEVYVCRECWATFTLFQRALFSLLATQTFEGGLAAGGELNAIQTELEKLRKQLRES